MKITRVLFPVFAFCFLFLSGGSKLLLVEYSIELPNPIELPKKKIQMTIIYLAWPIYFQFVKYLGTSR